MIQAKLPHILPPNLYARIVLGKPLSQTNIRTTTLRGKSKLRYRRVDVSIRDSHTGMLLQEMHEYWVILSESQRDITPEAVSRIQSMDKNTKYFKIVEYVLSYQR